MSPLESNLIQTRPRFNDHIHEGKDTMFNVNYLELKAGQFAAEKAFQRNQTLIED